MSVTKADIKNVCGVSEVTINKCFRKLILIKDRIIPKCIIRKYEIK